VNFLRTPWELDGSITGTRKNQKIYKSETAKGEERGEGIVTCFGGLAGTTHTHGIGDQVH
jgi:hypothetical protein